MYIAISAGLFDGKRTLLYYADAIPDRVINNPFPFRGGNGNRMFYLPFVHQGKLSKEQPESIGTIAYTGKPDETTLAILQQNNILDFSYAGASLLRKLRAKGHSPAKIELLSFLEKPNAPERTVETAHLEEIARQLISLQVNTRLFQ